jgi:chemotaxis protein MotB
MDRRLYALIAILPGLALGCGHSEAEWKAQLARNEQLQSRCNADARNLTDQLAEAQERVGELERQLKQAGVTLEVKSTEVTKLSATLDDRERALAEYRARARQLEQIRMRFEVLRHKLDDLTQFGLAVSIRHNKMVISLPGDVLFDSGRDTLRKDGEKILEKVAVALRNDHSLGDRDYQVAGHTDNQPLQRGPYHDNWGLSLMRARSVLSFLVGKDGGLPRKHWSAAGFADTDPVANNASKDGQQKNRRCELVVLPDVDEVLDLQALAR